MWKIFLSQEWWNLHKACFYICNNPVVIHWSNTSLYLFFFSQDSVIFKQKVKSFTKPNINMAGYLAE